LQNKTLRQWLNQSKSTGSPASHTRYYRVYIILRILHNTPLHRYLNFSGSDRIPSFGDGATQTFLRPEECSIVMKVRLRKKRCFDARPSMTGEHICQDRGILDESTQEKHVLCWIFRYRYSAGGSAVLLSSASRISSHFWTNFECAP